MDKVEFKYWVARLEGYKEQFKEACYIKQIRLTEVIKNIESKLNQEI